MRFGTHKRARIEPHVEKKEHTAGELGKMETQWGEKEMNAETRQRELFLTILFFPLLLRLKVKVDLIITVRVWYDMAASYERHLEGFEGGPLHFRV